MTIERAGKEFVIAAKVQQFLPGVPEEATKKKRK